MSSGSTRPDFLHWAIVVPLLALLVFGAAILFHEPRPPRTIPIQLTPPAQADLAEIPLPARVRLLEGRVVDAEGVAQANALVWLFSGDEPRWTNTKADGTFRLDGLQRGPWDVRVLAEDHRPHALVLRDTGVAQEVRLPDARRTGPVVPALERARLVGTLIGSADQELDGAEVVLTPTSPPETLDAPLPRRARADASGRFEFEELVAGEYRVAVIPGWARGGSWPDIARPVNTAQATDNAAPPTPGDALTFVHRADGSAPLSIELLAGSATGSLVDTEGRSLEGAFVLITPTGRPDRPWPPVATDARGEFEFRGLPPGHYALQARAGSATYAREFEVTPRSRIELGVVPTAVAR
ncbi:MAG: carboxypeptidase-like regulatory domain-containing protein [Planctomycetota bacterium]|nr:carboxypeptidase-like regulatory domain-containing protein [Planctomycetota bacterium]